MVSFDQPSKSILKVLLEKQKLKIMGKGDKKSKKGKINRGSYGKTRLKNKSKANKKTA